MKSCREKNIDHISEVTHHDGCNKNSNCSNNNYDSYAFLHNYYKYHNHNDKKHNKTTVDAAAT